MVLEMGKKREDGWDPSIFRTEAILGKGVVEVVFGMYRHKQTLMQTRVMERKLKERAKVTFLQILQSEVMNRFVEKIERDGQWDHIVSDLMEKRTDPYSLAQHMMRSEFGKTDASIPQRERGGDTGKEGSTGS
jgi:putative protein kinase ArgK-like GTPase of G3E family